MGLETREKKLSAQVARAESALKDLRRKLQLVHMKMAGRRRRATSQATKAVGVLLAKTNPELFDKLVKKLSSSAPKRRRRSGRRAASSQD